MKGKVNLASAARKASAKGRLSRPRVGARSMGEKEAERGEREGIAQHAREPENNTTGTQTQNNTTKYCLNRRSTRKRSRRRTFVGPQSNDK